MFAMARGGVLPAALAKTNGRGAPSNASITTSVITGLVIVVFALFQLDPFLTMFSWFSGLAVLAIVVIEILVCIAVIVYFRSNRSEENIFQTIIAPVLAILGLAVGAYLLMSRFAILAGTAAEGVDPTVTPWSMNAIGWTLVLLPFVVLLVGFIVSRARRNVNEELLRDVVS
jgi:amino acid transporter